MATWQRHARGPGNRAGNNLPGRSRGPREVRKTLRRENRLVVRRVLRARGASFSLRGVPLSWAVTTWQLPAAARPSADGAGRRTGSRCARTSRAGLREVAEAAGGTRRAAFFLTGGGRGCRMRRNARHAAARCRAWQEASGGEGHSAPAVGVSAALSAGYAAAAVPVPAPGAARTGRLGREELIMATWVFEPGHTAAEFRARHMMVSWVRGHFKDVYGSLEFDRTTPTGWPSRRRFGRPNCGRGSRSATTACAAPISWTPRSTRPSRSRASTWRHCWGPS